MTEEKEIKVRMHTSHNHSKWIIETELPDWEETVKYWNEPTEEVDVVNTASNVASQIYFKEDEGVELADHLRSFVNFLLEDMQAPVRAGNTKVAWTIEYQPQGWQAAHNHSGPFEVISVVLCLEGEEESGTFFAMLPEPDGTQNVVTIEQTPGTMIICEGDVWHGAYPCTTGKKVYVFDFWQEIINNESDNREVPVHET